MLPGTGLEEPKMTPTQNCFYRAPTVEGRRIKPGIVRTLTMGLVVGLASIWAPAAEAQDYPTKPVTMIVPFVPGGAVDTSARLVAEKLSEKLGQQFVVENRPGASGSIGYTAVARAASDGYTILYGYSTTSTCSPHIFKDLSWKPADFQPIAATAQFPLAITVNAQSIPVSTLKELIDYLKAHPGEVNYAALGVGTQVHIATELFRKTTGTEMTAVQYKGSGEVVSDLLAGNVQFVFDALGPYRQHVASGALKTIAVADVKRDANMPDVPTTEEAGLSGLIQTGFMPMFVPADTDPAIVAKLDAAVKAVSEDAGFKEKLTGVKLNDVYVGTQELTALLEKLSTQCADVVASAGITAP